MQNKNSWTADLAVDSIARSRPTASPSTDPELRPVRARKPSRPIQVEHQVDRRAVLVEDPDLGVRLEPMEFREARMRCSAPWLVAEPSGWADPWPFPSWSDCLGLLIIRGHLASRTVIAGRSSLEILGPGDVAQPWCDRRSGAIAGATASWSALDEVSALVLDRRFQQTAARWPDLLAEIMNRALRRADRLAADRAVDQMPKLAERLHLVLWRLGQRFGRVTPEGVRLPVRLSHQHLAELCSAQRPSVSQALGVLTRNGQVTKLDSGALVVLPSVDNPPTTQGVSQGR